MDSIDLKHPNGLCSVDAQQCPDDFLLFWGIRDEAWMKFVPGQGRTWKKS